MPRGNTATRAGRCWGGALPRGNTATRAGRCWATLLSERGGASSWGDGVGATGQHCYQSGAVPGQRGGDATRAGRCRSGAVHRCYQSGAVHRHGATMLPERGGVGAVLYIYSHSAYSWLVQAIVLHQTHHLLLTYSHLLLVTLTYSWLLYVDNSHSIRVSRVPRVSTIPRVSRVSDVSIALLPERGGAVH